MTKADLIEEVSRVVEMTRKESEVIVEAIFDSIVRSLRAGDKIEIRGFGSFRTRQRQPRIGRNPKTGARSQSLLWNLYRHETAPDTKKISLLFGLFQYQSSLTGKGWRVCYIPFGKVNAPATEPSPSR